MSVTPSLTRTSPAMSPGRYELGLSSYNIVQDGASFDSPPDWFNQAISAELNPVVEATLSVRLELTEYAEWCRQEISFTPCGKATTTFIEYAVEAVIER